MIQVFGLDILKTFKSNILTVKPLTSKNSRNIFNMIYSRTVWVGAVVSKIGS